KRGPIRGPRASGHPAWNTAALPPHVAPLPRKALLRFRERDIRHGWPSSRPDSPVRRNEDRWKMAAPGVRLAASGHKGGNVDGLDLRLGHPHLRANRSNLLLREPVELLPRLPDVRDPQSATDLGYPVEQTGWIWVRSFRVAPIC